MVYDLKGKLGEQRCGWQGTCSMAQRPAPAWPWRDMHITSGSPIVETMTVGIELNIFGNIIGGFYKYMFGGYLHKSTGIY